ncbi:uncharacterized protein BO95DRAFT_431136 [Aspergillus brunneoviolaceus CBS 621.78]|uniref:Uncharacterized protein n=1 Tax=Aspergillus brunneoviolaceus CBS 621.78 TaxID=1450534 RepID=A0ACD1GB85_9EURO|nr:hypothetical protein BO95DRAFT_431136 [Aspergillus brunneoviolaceus CBS 621.78]RAH46527.1 hypothetical protein BO95DRAFT_431136 [Aspergillus brunneoviolaceus CBS 621.78]
MMRGLDGIVYRGHMDALLNSIPKADTQRLNAGSGDLEQSVKKVRKGCRASPASRLIDVDHHSKGDQAEAERDIDFPVHIAVEWGRRRASGARTSSRLSVLVDHVQIRRRFLPLLVLVAGVVIDVVRLGISWVCQEGMKEEKDEDYKDNGEDRRKEEGERRGNEDRVISSQRGARSPNKIAASRTVAAFSAFLPQPLNLQPAD